MSVQAQTTAPVTQSDDVLQYEVNDGIATIWLNRPHKRNCINWDLLIKLGEALARAVVIRGRGGTFCAGADLDMLDEEFLATTNASIKIAKVSAQTFGHAFNLEKPTIAAVEGYAGAGGGRFSTRHACV